MTKQMIETRRNKCSFFANIQQIKLIYHYPRVVTCIKYIEKSEILTK